MKNLILAVFALVLASGVLAGCIEDDFTTSPSDQPTFSVDTLDMGLMFTEEPSTTHRFTVYNHAGKALNISQISLSGENSSLFRLNVDGFSGTSFANVEIRPKDSIFVFVEATLPANGVDVPVDVEASLDFTTNGVTQSVILAAQGRDVERLRAVVIDSDARFTAAKPYQIFDSLVVAEGATLTLEAGTMLCFHDKSYMAVRGTLISQGTTEAPVNLAGDRTGNVVADISFDIMSRQWVGVFFTATSRGNTLNNTHIRNTWQGVCIDGTLSDTAPDLTLVNSTLRNSAGHVLEAIHADVTAIGCEFAEAGGGSVVLRGGKHVMNHCTLSNYYLFSALDGPILALAHLNADDDDGSGKPFTAADISNSIIYGNGNDISHGDLAGTEVYLRSCLLKSAGTDDDNFINCLWDTDPLFYTVREDYIFDYRLRPESPAIGAADPALTLPAAAVDRYGLARGAQPDLGAYVYTEEL